MSTTAVIERLRGERQVAADYIEHTMEAVQSEQRDLSETEQRSLTTHRERMEEIDHQLKPLVEYEQVRASAVTIDDRLLRRGDRRDERRQPDGGGEALRSFGDLYIESEAYQHRGISATYSDDDVDATRLAMQTRALLTTGAAPGSAMLPRPERYEAAMPDLLTPLLDAVTRVTVTTGSVDVITWSEFSGADVVAEGAQKPELATPVGVESLPLQTIAGHVKYTRQLAEDVPAFAAYLSQGITREMLRKMQGRVSAAVAAASLPSTVGAAGQPAHEVVLLGMSTVEAAGYSPNVVIANPATIANLRLSVLFLGGAAALTGIGGGTWGLTPVPVAGFTGIVVADAMDAITMFTRSGIRIYTTDSDISGAGNTAASDFRANILTTLGETRVGAKVTQPNAATRLTITPA